MKFSNSIKGIKLYFFLIVIVLVSGSFYTQDECLLKIPAVNKDVTWLKKYTSIYEIFNQDQWEKNTKRSFDSNGVHITLGQWGPYHPVNACHYALFCYDEYKNSGNERFKTAFLNQVKFLMNPQNYTSFDSDKIGYHYKFTFHDLKNPFFSSLAQGEAISVLIRYYALTKDANALELIVKAKNFMVYPEAKGGCYSINPEGNEWMEEYPNSKQEAHNFSGFYIAVIALGEYSKLFPSDTATSNLFQRLLQSGKMSHKIYDNGSGILYNRGDKRLCAPGYLKWLTNVMLHVYEFTGDKFFLYQHQIWATYSSGKDYVDIGVKKDYYNWAVPIELVNGKYLPKEEIIKTRNSIDYLVKEIYPATLKEAAKINDKNAYAAVNFFMNDTISQKPFVLMEPKTTAEIAKLSVQLNKETMSEKSIEIKYQTLSDKGWRNVKIINFDTIAPKNFIYSFEKIHCSSIKVFFNVHEKDKILPVTELKIFKADTIEVMPEYYFYTTAPYQLAKNKAELNCSFNGVEDYNVFVRKSDTKEKLKNTYYEILETNNKLPIQISEQNKFYQFLVVFGRKNNQSSLKKVELN